ncbi:MAG: protein TolR [Pseudomonadota bacterium]
MAMSYSPGRPGKRRLNAEINVVPYIDVMLVLLIIFMVTAPLLTQGVVVELPQEASEPITLDEQPVVFSVDAKGNYFLDIGTNNEEPLADADVAQRVGAVLRNKPETVILIHADRKVDYGRVAKGMALLNAAGASKLGFRMDPSDKVPASK